MDSMTLFGLNKKINADFDEFKSQVSWFIKKSTQVEIRLTEDLPLSSDFKDTFPTLTRLIGKARVTSLTIDFLPYKLYAWDNKNGEICGWLCKIESEEINKKFIEEHTLLLNNIGGIKESFNQPDSFSNNQNFMFIASECKTGIQPYENYYADLCNEQGIKQNNYSHLISFVQEANGSLTLYDTISKQVLLLSHDHSFDYVEALENEPENTFYRFTNANTFTDYAEKLAEQWLNKIE